MRKATDIQKETLLYHYELEYCPSIREIAAKYGITLKAASDRVEALIKKGYLVKDSMRARGRRLTELGLKQIGKGQGSSGKGGTVPLRLSFHETSEEATHTAVVPLAADKFSVAVKYAVLIGDDDLQPDIRLGDIAYFGVSREYQTGQVRVLNLSDGRKILAKLLNREGKILALAGLMEYHPSLDELGDLMLAVARNYD